MKVLIVHYDKLKHRKENRCKQLSLYKELNYEYISNYGKDNLTIENKKMFRNISDAEISVALHHIECFKEISEKYDFAIILEDDIVLCPNFYNILNMYIKQLPDNWDMLFIGNGCNLHIPNEMLMKQKYIYKRSNSLGATRCLDSYLITKKCANIILEKLKLPNYTILCPVDHWLNYVIKNNNFNVYWAEPSIITQGSQNGLFTSSIR
jgi:glycosyl transferase family 25